MMINNYILVEIMNNLHVRDIFRYAITNRESYIFVVKSEFKFTLNKFDFLARLITAIEKSDGKLIKWLFKQNVFPTFDKTVLPSLSLILTNNVPIVELVINNCGLNKDCIEKSILILRNIYYDKGKLEAFAENFIQASIKNEVIEKLVMKVFCEFRYVKKNGYKNNMELLKLIMKNYKTKKINNL